MAHEKAHEMVQSFERSLRAQSMEPEQYYQLAGSNHADFEQRVRPDAEDTVKKELVLDAVAVAEGIKAGEDEVMHEISHLAADSERNPEEIAATLHANGTYALLEEEISRQKALEFLAKNAVPVPMPEEETQDDETVADEEAEPKAEAADEPVEAKAGVAGAENDEREEKE
jgi:trigger factor